MLPTGAASLSRFNMRRKTVCMTSSAAPGLPAFAIVGLPDKAVSEARERVRSALIASGLALPARRITVNLAPADLFKEGSHFDLPIALGMLIAMGAIESDAVAPYAVLGELGLAGNARYVEHATLESQKVMRLDDFNGANAPYFSMLLVHRRGEAWS